MNFLKSDGYEPYVVVPVSEAALQYFSKKYGSKEIRVDGYSEWFPMIKMALEKKPYQRLTCKKRKPSKALTFILPVRYRFAHITVDSVSIMAEWIDSQMMRDLMLFVSGSFHTGSSEQAAVQTFIDLYDLPMDMDTLRMKYRRSDEFKFNMENNVVNVVRQADKAVHLKKTGAESTRQLQLV